MIEQSRANVGDDAGGQPCVPFLVPDRDDRGEDAGDRKHAEYLVQRLEVFLAERIIDQEFQAERHDDVEQRLHHDADADEDQHLLVIGEVRRDEAVDRRERAGGFLRGKDDEILVLLLVELEFKLVVFALLVIVGRRRRLVGGTQPSGLPGNGRLVRDSGGLVLRDERLGRH